MDPKRSEIASAVVSDEKLFNYLIIFALITPALCQYYRTGLKPDVTFGEHNDRFDVSRILRQQKRYDKNYAIDEQSEEYRRRGLKRKHKGMSLKDDRENRIDKEKVEGSDALTKLNTRKGRKHIGKLKKKIVRELEDHVNELANSIIKEMRSLRRNEDFAYHDNMKSDGLDTDSYNNNLKRFEDIFKIAKVDAPSRRLQDIVNKLHGSKQTRRFIVDPEKEILLHYAFPLDMNIEGFLQVPNE